MVSVSKDLSLKTETIKHLCQRRAGIGADQLIVVDDPSTTEDHYPCSIFNADGSQAEQCGNGLRCVAKLLSEQHQLSKLSLVVAGHPYEFNISQDSITCNMGNITLDPKLIPLQTTVQQQCYQLQLNNDMVEFFALSIGNPHAVIVCDQFNTDHESHISKQLCQHPFFPKGINIGFMHKVDADHIELRVHERGVGHTPSCGSGACAAAVCGMRYAGLNNSVQVTQPGGQLTVSWSGQLGDSVFLTGTAYYSYTGNIRL